MEPAMKIIFLDVDGVLNCSNSKTRSPSGFIGVDDEKVLTLREIVRQTGAKIVLTSTWKKGWSPDRDLQSPDARYLSSKLFRKGLIIFDKTDDLGDPELRGTGIVRWLQAHPPVTSWLVLDDDIFPDYDENGILSHLVHTGFFLGGLDKSMIPACVGILNGESIL